MNEQEIPIKDQEGPSLDGHNTAVAPEERGGTPPGPDAFASQQARPITPPSFSQPVQPPPWQVYPPTTPSPWNRQPGQYYPPYQNRQPGQYYPPYQKRPARWPWVILTLFLLFLLIIGGAFVLFSVIGYTGFSNTTIETQNFTMTANPTLVLNNDTGSFHVRASSSNNVITIQATKHSNPWTNPSDISVNYTQNQATNTLTVNIDRHNNATFFTSPSVDFDVAIPASATLQLKTNTGSIDVTGVSGEMVLTSNTGSLQVTSGTVSGHTSLTTNTGSVTFNGAIDRNGTYNFGTNTGSVNVTLPAASAFHVNASTDIGSINTNFSGISVQHNQTIGASASGDVGSSPRATITLKSNTGSINLYQS